MLQITSQPQSCTIHFSNLRKLFLCSISLMQRHSHMTWSPSELLSRSRDASISLGVLESAAMHAPKTNRPWGDHSLISPLKTSVAHNKQHRAHVTCARRVLPSQSHDLSAVDADAVTHTHTHTPAEAPQTYRCSEISTCIQAPYCIFRFLDYCLLPYCHLWDPVTLCFKVSLLYVTCTYYYNNNKLCIITCK